MGLQLLTLQILSCTLISIIVIRHTQCVTLTVSNNDNLENTDVHLRCWNEGILLTAVRWTQKTPIQQAIMSFTNNICSANAGFIQDSSRYSYNCTDGKSFIVTIKSISREINGQIWLCDFGTSLTASNEITIYVNVPVSKSIISPNIKTITASENSIITLQCTTTECRPEPKFTWYKDNSMLTDGDEIIMSQSGNAISSAPIIQTYTNYFSITLRRDLNGWYIFCSAGNYNGGSVPSDKILLNITYPPDRPPAIGSLVNGSEVKSIQGEHVDLECSITGGNPLPSLQWDRNNESPMNIIGNKVTKTISWQAVGTDPVELICRSLHPNRNDSVNVKMNILYSPGSPDIWIEGSHGRNVYVNKTLYVIEGQRFILRCFAKSNPPVSLYKWNQLMPTNMSTFNFDNYDRNTKQISCYVSNEMKTSDSRPALIGANTAQLAVSVLYPPTVNTMSDRTVEEGADIVYPCDFLPGNPSVTNVTWSWNGTTWNDRLLTISNVTRHQAGVYRCDVRNLMVSSDRTNEFGNDFGELNLSVQYKTTVLRFLINEHNNNVTVNENDTVSLVCEIEGLPLPEAKLLNQQANFIRNQLVKKLFRDSTNQTILHLTNSFLAQCTDTGVQTCSGSNNLYNGLQSVSQKGVSLFVKCKPRRSPYFTILDIVRSPTSVDATLSFTALAFPVPSRSGYVWTRRKDMNDTWSNITASTSNIIISTSGLQSNLTIKDVSQSDYGIYRLSIVNDVGHFDYTFSLLPSVPTNDDTSASTSKARIVVPSATGAVCGVVFLVAVIIIVKIYKRSRRMQFKLLRGTSKYRVRPAIRIIIIKR